MTTLKGKMQYFKVKSLRQLHWNCDIEKSHVDCTSQGRAHVLAARRTMNALERLNPNE